MSAFVGAQRLTNRENLEPYVEQALIEQCRRNNLEAFGRLVDAYQARIHGFVRRTVSSADEAEDLTQEVFIRAFQNLSKFDGRSSLRTWLFRIAHNLCIDAARKRGRSIAEVRDTDESGELIDAQDNRYSPESLAMNRELMDVVEDAIAGLSEKLRSVLLLHDKEELEYEEIANVLDIPIGTVKSRLFLARAAVQKALEEYRK